MPVSIGLDIGTSAVRAAQVASGGRGPDRLQRLAEVPLPPGAVREGEIVDADAVVAALRQLWARHRFATRRVALGVANQHVVVRQVDLPSLPRRELRQSLQYQAADAIPIPVEQAILDFHVLGTFESEDGQPFSRLLLVAAQRDMVRSIVDVVERARLTPTVLDLDAFALLRSLTPGSLLGGGELVVDCGVGVTDVVVAEAGAPRFVRILSHDRVSAGVGAAPGPAPDDGAEAAPTTRLVEDLRGSLDFYASQPDAVPVRRVILSGGASRRSDLRERLAEAVGLPVEAGHPLQELKIGRLGLGPEALVAAEPHVAVAIGLALGGLGVGRRGLRR